MIYALGVRLSVIAAGSTGSPKTSLHRSKDRLVIIKADFLPSLSDRLLKSISALSLSNEMYAKSSLMT
jgi:hypothetical protein